MKRFILSLAVFSLCLSINAQTAKEEVFDNVAKSGGVYYAYPVTESANTPAPKGYEPFYISHYGRHGSRYLIADEDYTTVLDLLHVAQSHNALTPLGIDVMQRIDSLLLEVEGHGGALSPLGVRQQRAIAERMYKAYPQVFNILGTIGFILGPMFFFTVYIAGINASVSSNSYKMPDAVFPAFCHFSV